MLQDSYDIVVVGSGFAGFAAACAAQEQGVRRVLIIDKMPSIGGTSAYSRGVICIPGSEEQRHLGITDDSPELFHSDILVGGQHQNNWELSRILAEEAHSVYDYLKSLGIGFTADIAVLGGHSKKRALFHDRGAGGAGLLSHLFKHFTDGGGMCLTECVLDDIVFTQKRVTGIKVRKNHNYKNPLSGEPAAIGINKALIIASGGYAADIPFCTLQNPALKGLPTGAAPGATADVLRMLLRHGAMPMHLSSIQSGALSSLDERGSGITHQLCHYMKQYGIVIDPRTGRRFLNEMDTNLNQSAKISGAVPPVLIADRHIEGKVANSNFLHIPLSAAAAKAFPSLRDLAGFYQIPFEALHREVLRYNRMVAAGVDRDFAKPVEFADGVRINRAPFYAMRLSVKIHYCQGGVFIDRHARVVASDGSSFPNLYAAGEVSGGIHGRNRLGGCSIIDAFVFGRRASAHAARTP